VSTPRKQIAAAIAADNAGLDVVDYPWEPAELRKPLVVVWREDIAQATDATLAQSIEIRAYGVGTTSGKAEDELDDLLDAVLLSLRRLDTVALVKAQRRILANVFQGWEISCTWTAQDYYKTTVNNERNADNGA
jgi:hypothetical protein